MQAARSREERLQRALVRRRQRVLTSIMDALHTTAQEV